MLGGFNKLHPVSQQMESTTTARTTYLRTIDASACCEFRVEQNASDRVMCYLSNGGSGGRQFGGRPTGFTLDKAHRSAQIPDGHWPQSGQKYMVTGDRHWPRGRMHKEGNVEKITVSSGEQMDLSAREGKPESSLSSIPSPRHLSAPDPGFPGHTAPLPRGSIRPACRKSGTDNS